MNVVCKGVDGKKGCRELVWWKIDDREKYPGDYQDVNGGAGV